MIPLKNLEATLGLLAIGADQRDIVACQCSTLIRTTLKGIFFVLSSIIYNTANNIRYEADITNSILFEYVSFFSQALLATNLSPKLKSRAHLHSILSHSSKRLTLTIADKMGHRFLRWDDRLFQRQNSRGRFYTGSRHISGIYFIGKQIGIET